MLPDLVSRLFPPLHHLSMKFKTQCMLDLETLGTLPGSCIPTIGACVFNPRTGLIGEEHYQRVDIGSMLCAGFTVNPDTLAWWHKQSEKARRAAMVDGDCVHILDALEGFSNWLFRVTGQDLENLNVWGNGSDFDNALMAKAYDMVSRVQPWHFWNNRCYRTVKAMYPGIKIERGKGTHHNALDDAKAQAKHLLKLPVPATVYA